MADILICDGSPRRSVITEAQEVAEDGIAEKLALAFIDATLLLNLLQQ